MTRQPDEDYDVIVHQFCQYGMNGAGRNTWTILARGREAGRTGNAGRQRLSSPAMWPQCTAGRRWLLAETGYPLKPIERGAIH